jgi:LuxR family maltose regulon positive regulatory protein
MALATCERHAEAEARVERLLGRADADAALRCECALILGSAAIFADEPDRFLALHEPWVEQPPLSDSLLLAIHANRNAFRALLLGQPATARRNLSSGAGQGLRYVAHWADLIQGLAYLWEGQVRLAEAQLGPSLARAEAQLGRRSPFACMQAALLAACVWEQGRAEESTALLAHRLDVIERSGLPDIVMLAYRTLARMASAAGAEHRALELLAALGAVGQARGLPRLVVVSLAEQLRLHARQYRAETCKALLAELEALIAGPAFPTGPVWRRGIEMQLALARGHAALAQREWRAALAPLEIAAGGAQHLQLQRFRIEALGLRAFAMDRCGEREGRQLMHEVLGLAGGLGLQRVFSDAHPDLGDWVIQASPPDAMPAAPQRPALPATVIAPKPGLASGTALTPKEREVLELLGRNLSNKEVALALQVGEETVKRHVKNLFAKLDAGTRKQVVARARILGLLPPVG